MAKLTPKQQKFADFIAQGYDQKTAYAMAYDVKSESDKGNRSNASKIANNPKVIEAIAEYRQPIVQQIGITLESHLQTLSDIAREAREAGQYSAAVAAEVARAKAAGIHIDRSEQTIKGMIGHITVPPDQLKDVAARLLSKV
jgi:phage terminase small subunit